MRFFIQSDKDKARAIEYISHQQNNITIIIENGLNGKRSLNQNKLQRLWMNELAEQGDMSAEEYRALCKLTIGVPILRHENDKFRHAYDEHIKWRDYKEKLMFMAEPFDFPVTRLMTVKQHKKFLDCVRIYFTQQGFYLTDPEDLKWYE